MYHVRVAVSKSSALSTHASKILACLLLLNVVFFSCFFALNHSFSALCFLFLISCSAPIQLPSILIFLPSSLPNSSISSLSSLFFSSYRSMTSLMVLTRSSISSLLPTIVVSSANKDTVTTLVSASLLYFSHRLPLGKEFPGCHLHFTPTSSPRSSALLLLSSSASLITTWWKMLKRVGDVAHPSLRPPSGVHSSLSFSVPFTQYNVACLVKILHISSVTFPLRPYLSNIPHRAGLFTLG